MLEKRLKWTFFLFLLLYTPLYCHQSVNYANSNIGPIAKEITSRNLLEKSKKCKNLSYYLYIDDFIQSFIEIPTSNVLIDSSTISSKYLAGRAPLYNMRNEKVGTCSASFLCIQNADGIYTDISNYLSVDSGLIVSWFTPTTLINLELDTIVHSMVTECLVEASTKIGFNPFYGKKFNLIVSSDNERIYFKFSKKKTCKCH